MTNIKIFFSAKKTQMISKKMRSGHGAVVVATAFALIPILFVCAFLMDGSRTMLAKGNIQSTEQLTIQSILSHSDPILQDYYGLFGLQQDMNAGALIDTKQFGEEISGSKEVTDRYINEFINNVTGANTTGGSDFMQIRTGDTDQFKLRGVENASLQNPTVLETQINDFAKYRSVVQFISDLVKHKDDLKDTEESSDLVQQVASVYNDYFDLVSELNAALREVVSLGNKISDIYYKGTDNGNLDKYFNPNGSVNLPFILQYLSQIDFNDLHSDTSKAKNDDPKVIKKRDFFILVNILKDRLPGLDDPLSKLPKKIEDAQKKAHDVNKYATDIKSKFSENGDYKISPECTKGEGDQPPEDKMKDLKDAQKSVYSMCWSIYHTDNSIKQAPWNKINLQNFGTAKNEIDDIASKSREYINEVTDKSPFGIVKTQDYKQWYSLICDRNSGKLTSDFVSSIIGVDDGSTKVPSLDDMGDYKSQAKDAINKQLGKSKNGKKFSEILDQFTSAVANIKNMTRMGTDSKYYINANKDTGILPSRAWCKYGTNSDAMCDPSDGVGDLFKDIGTGLFKDIKGMISLIKDFANADFSAIASSIVTSGYCYYMFDDFSSSAPTTSAAYSKTLKDKDKVLPGENDDLQEYSSAQLIGENLKYHNYSDLEYIISGHSGQYTPLTEYTQIFLLRFVLDFTSTFSYEELQPLFEALNGIPFVGPVLAILAHIAIAFVEASNDMVHMTLKGEKVPLYKGSTGANWYLLGEYDEKEASFGFTYRNYLAMSMIAKISNDSYREAMLMRVADVLQSKMYYAYKGSQNYNTIEAKYYAENWRMKNAITNVQLRGNFKSNPFFMNVIPSDYFRGLKNSNGWGFYNFSVNSVGGY